jgi:DNA-binding NarL/FixJ family response regulator
MKILLVDDHALFREGVCLLLRGLSNDVCVIEARDSLTAFSALAEHDDLDLLLLDLNIPGADGFSILASAAKQYPTVPIAVLSASDRKEDVDRVMATSAMGYIHKNTSSKVMLGAIRLMLEGGLYTPPVAALSGNHNIEHSDAGKLTIRQLEVLALLANGDTNKCIARKLNIAEATVKMHVTAILKSLGVLNRTQAALVSQKLI